MASTAILEQAKAEDWSDEHVVQRVLEGELALYELLMRRHNQRVYRVARAILRDDAEAEDVMQEAYVRAYKCLGDFEGRAKFVTWLTRIAVNEALARARKRVRFQSLDVPEGTNGDAMESATSANCNPEQEAYGRELGAVLEKAISTLSEEHRLVFVMRDIEGMSTEETARCLELTEENVKVRLHRARAGLRERLQAAIGKTAPQCFQFHATRCDRVVAGVFQALDVHASSNSPTAPGLKPKSL